MAGVIWKVSSRRIQAVAVAFGLYRFPLAQFLTFYFRLFFGSLKESREFLSLLGHQEDASESNMMNDASDR